MFKKMKTSELAGAALDWAVAKCEGYQPVYTNGALYPMFRKYEKVQNTRLCYSVDWAISGPIIEREKINIYAVPYGWHAIHAVDMLKRKPNEGASALIAAMRCYVASKLGDEVEIPQELL
jgi:hypothetical protein